MRGRARGWHRPLRSVALGVAALAAVTATLPAAPSGQPPAGGVLLEAAAEQTYQGDALLLGFFFGLGPVAERHPNLVLRELTDETPENIALAEAEINAIPTRVPDFLEQYAAAVYSGSPERIWTTTIEAARLLWDVLLVKTDSTSGAIDPGPPGEALPDTDGISHTLLPVLYKWVFVVAETFLG